MSQFKLSKKKKYLLACSFGPDSMAAFYLLFKNGYKFECAIVNYHLRKESDLEVKGLLEYAKSKDIKVHVLDVKEKIKKNVEARCREIRYNFFNSLIINSDLDALIVAHNEDDHIETYLLQKKRKILPKHYGIAEKSWIYGVDVYRPLLGYSKKRLLSICDKNDVPYMIDKSNLSDDYLRNQIRHQIVSKLKLKERKQIVKDIEKENEELDNIFSNIASDRMHKISYLLSLDEITYLYVINAVAQEAGSEYKISRKQGQEIIKMMKSNKPNIISKIYGDLYFFKEYYDIHFEKGYKKLTYLYLRVVAPTIIDNEYIYFDLTKDVTGRNIHDYDYPLIIRAARKDDIYKIKDYETSVRRLFIDWKMPSSLRDRWPVVLDKNSNIIYIPRYQKDFTIDDSSDFYVKI